MNNIDLKSIPEHVAIIMDGNGRWAAAKGQPRNVGHRAGVETVRRITAECVRLGVKYLTLYTFSTENWNRPADEVSALMGLVLTSLEDEIFMKHNVRFRVIGDLKRLPKDVQEKLWQTMERTAENDAMTMVVALSYSARWEITDAVREIASSVIQDYATGYNINEIRERITEDTISQNLNTYFMPDPDLLIRTGGEKRLSNFLLWELSYAELYVTDTYWPDFDERELQKALESFGGRKRRFGGLNNQNQ